jgi:hypothetical protein
MSNHKWHRALVLAVLGALGLTLAGVFVLQSTPSNAQFKKDDSRVAQAQTPPATTTPPPQAAAPPAPPSLVVGGVDVGKQVNDSLNSLRSILEGITDVASAQAASRQLQNVIAQIERFDVLFPQLSVEQRTAFAGIVNAQMATINPLFDKVLAIPNVAQVLTPTIASLKLKLAVIQTTPSVIVGGVDIGKQLSDTLNSLGTILEGITDVASAQAALPQLQGVIAEIERLDNLFLQLSSEQRAVLASIVNAQMPTLNQLFDKVLAIPGVAQVLKPTIDSLRPKLALLQTTTTGGAVVEIVLKEERDNCIRPRRGQRPDPSCCVEKLRLVSGTAQFTTNAGNVGNLTEVNTVACVSPTGEISYWKSEESILGFDVAIAAQPPAAPAAPAAPGAPGAPGAAPGVPPTTPPATPISPPGGGVIPPIIIPTPPTCVPTASNPCP